MNTAKEFKTLYIEQGVKALQAEFTREAASRGTGRVFFELISSEGKLLATSDLGEWNRPEMLSLDAAIPSQNKTFFRTISMPGHRHKIRVISMSATDGKVIRIGSTLKGDELLLERYRETFGTALAIMLVCGGLVGWLLARKAMSGVKRVTETATRIGRHDFGRRVTVTGEGEEISALVQAFNDMLERIESLLNELQQITDNVAHELRTPITRIRGIAETTLKGNNGDLDEFRAMAASVIEGSDDLIEMIGTMLEIAKTDSGVAELAVAPLDIREIVEDAVDLFAPAAEDRRIRIHLSNPPKAVMILGDRQRLQRVVANLLDNAIKYTPPGGNVTLSVVAEEAGAKVEITDTGVGIDETDIPRIFDRFYRGDKSRSTAGSGLGLSLALAIIRAHGGDITAKSTGSGSSFTVFLPNKPSSL
ncbi:HAMP domain-containing protein [Dissulfurirhabdus thermomarina]|uniref:histidine kinase n=1 Tax=Dissulfurirhabdus thermomarina TaxID=1765737 RepID=A0A6N9TJW9_DISTH|nr:ATP-binding protein [Dissulfurirhabdus thermomarina]NDY41561.1 HAMP domain-containing protein [Dissulfurirhabdus thermomarina]NMX24526.1 HAMP domain-containing protein [Dissulfurirhabdus thermomarina]